jgi:hypothetical protein
MERMWINAPSTLQSCHGMHGTCVLAGNVYGTLRQVFFLEGDTISQMVPENALSTGWPSKARWATDAGLQGLKDAGDFLAWAGPTDGALRRWARAKEAL